MSNFTADDVQNVAVNYRVESRDYTAEMLDDLARRLRQEEDENKRDPVTDPRVGDRIIFECGDEVAWNTSMDYPKGRQDWKQWAGRIGSTIIRRREVAQ